MFFSVYCVQKNYKQFDNVIGRGVTLCHPIIPDSQLGMNGSHNEDRLQHIKLMLWGTYHIVQECKTFACSSHRCASTTATGRTAKTA